VKSIAGAKVEVIDSVDIIWVADSHWLSSEKDSVANLTQKEGTYRGWERDARGLE
jgi:hypothetical protein